VNIGLVRYLIRSLIWNRFFPRDKYQNIDNLRAVLIKNVIFLWTTKYKNW